MKNIVLKFGLISGAVLAAMTTIMVALMMSGQAGFKNSEIVGYTTMVLASLAIFFGIRTYRDGIGNGTITFGRAFKVGILIALVSSAVYVITWEIVYFNFVPDFADKYAAFSMEKMRADGASASELATAHAKMEDFKRMYKNPFFNIGMTFLEVFPVGLIVTLVSAGILRKKQTPGAPDAATVAA